jgi:hypothetical protein
MGSISFNSFNMWKLPALVLGFTGVSFLLGSCASTNQKPVSVGSPFPNHYNSGTRDFEGTWPYGPGGYR